MASDSIAEILIKWYNRHKRDLPWRHTKDPYQIWLSEIILQQTQVVQGLSYFLKFIDKYPKVTLLARAKQDEVLKLWQGLGYYSRARNLHETAQRIATEYNGRFPSTYEELLKLKGVGEYTAAAISSFAYNLPNAVVDGNVYRVLSRLFDIKTAINSTKGQKLFKDLAHELLPKNKAAIYNQAIMEFGSQWCKPVNPDCENCVLQDKCLAKAHNTVAQRPVKEKKIKNRNRYFNYFLIIDKHGNVLVNQRTEKDIWNGLFELYLIESKEPCPLSELLKDHHLSMMIGTSYTIIDQQYETKHLLSHQTIYAQFYTIQLKSSFGKKTKSVPIKKLNSLAWPRLIDKFLNICALDI